MDKMYAFQHLDRLEQVKRSMEGKWGVNRLQDMVGEELAGKMDRQYEKLSQAITECRYEDVSALADGAVRGWNAMDAAADKAGYSKYVGLVIEGRMPDGRVLRIHSNVIDSKISAKNEGVENITIDEVCRIVESYSLANRVDALAAVPMPPENDRWKTFNWRQGGDDIPF